MEKQQKKWPRRGVMNLMDRDADTDVLGSYTGVPRDPDDLIPVQDADDL
ncbi:MAG: hypothetical protein IJB69_08770 [Clostridia bacterium]|nr:hypothetical protein [Clostridia bacterium]